MKKHLITGLFAALALSASAQSFKEWIDPEVNAVNRAPMHTNYFAYESADAATRGVKEQSSRFMTLNGTWKFFWVKDADARPTDFWRVGRGYAKKLEPYGIFTMGVIMTKAGTTSPSPVCGN